MPLTEQEILALSLGASVAQLSEAVNESTKAPVVVEPTASVTPVAESATATVEPAPAAPAAAEQPVKGQDVQAFLTAQVQAKDAQILELTVSAREMKAELDSARVTHSPLVKIVGDKLNGLLIANGGAEIDLSALSVVDLLKQHDAAMAVFVKKYPVGGKAITAPAEKTPESEAAAVSPLDRAKLSAVRIGKR